MDETAELARRLMDLSAERARVLMHLLDGSRPEPVKDMEAITEELQEFSPELAAKPQVLAVLGPGEFFGEMALFEGQSRVATVRALEDTECLAMTGWDFRAELSTDAEIAMAVLETVVRRLRELEARLTE